MKNIAAQMVNFDREQMRRIANNMPEQHDDKPQVEQVAKVINNVFSQLMAAFPATTANRSQAEMNEIRRQWVLAFRENGITTMEQVAAGMRVARRQERPFLPSPGQFVAWCREGRCVLGVTVADVMAEYWKWQKLVFRYTSSEKYPWPKDVLYHICLELRHRSTEGQLSRKELEREAVEVLDMWERRVLSGKPIPPVRRALAAPSRDLGPTPAEMLMAKYKQRKEAGLI
ncbi:phage replication protein [Salmonella enterica]|uniref:Phage replication protein n=2 Tax=Salmonella enterica TaxID=28901 RepID=A0A757XLQ8_SALER|nr:replication protein P [Salmonella enterica]EBP4060820.1 phage replication protein [Salmonella enterica subsp. enterica]EBR9059980.1 phage replication protein [Salmonella enterica subsp. enterica serovar Koketime]EDI0749004.1 phage replication protein [Salmonella enterica subsp. enterica serovar Kisarawe]EIT8390774.1 phage replication protein [Salmonella enterica subsp. enterica serovar Cotham]AXD43076.1 phage replication protein [Salmonella enterica]